MTMHNIYRDGRVHICKEMCSTCIFRPGNLMSLQPGRVKGMIAEATADESTIVCHQTLGGDNAACHGFYKLHATIPLRLAPIMGVAEWVVPNAKES